MLAYLGSVFILIGVLIFVTSATSNSINVFTALGGFISAMGIILYIGLRLDHPKTNEYRFTEELVGARNSLYNMESEIARFKDMEKRSSGNKAFGFVLLSIGIFVLGISGLLGLFIFLWPLSLVGLASLIGGIILRYGQ